MNKWQPIETAPKDGSNILLYSPDGIYEASWSLRYPPAKDGFWRPLDLPSHGCGCCGEPDDEPTHWMPLPEPPEGGT